MFTAKNLRLFAWLLSFVTLGAAFLAWGSGVRWNFSSLSLYDIFPLLGLSAFSLMWGHYIMAALRQKTGHKKEVLYNYFELTSTLVLIAILLHPGLFIWQLWRDGFGLPPDSYRAYVGSAGMAFVLLGTISLLAFLAYEFRRQFADKSWWQFIQYASDAAMIAIFVHALKLGDEVQGGWYRTIWLFYGISYVIALLYLYWPKFSPRSTNKVV